MKPTTWMTMLGGGYATAAILAIALLLVPIAQAQTFNVIHTFTGGADGDSPSAGLTLDAGGNLYGTSSHGGYTGGSCPKGCGTVYQLKRSGSNWIFGRLYVFTESPDGAFPMGGVSFGPHGALYGTTYLGGTNDNGTIFKLTPPAIPCPSCPWTESVLYRFQGGSDGMWPEGDLHFDPQGHIYGTTTEGGVYAGHCRGFMLPTLGCGTVYQLTPSLGSWTHRVVYRFQGPGDNYADGVSPYSGVILDNAGNLYGTAVMGGAGGYWGCGVVFKLSPSGNNWIQRVLYRFLNGSDGCYPKGGLIFDRSANLYGAVYEGGVNRGGTAYELKPSNGAWRFNLLYSFFSGTSFNFGPDTRLTMDAAGNLYGTTNSEGAYGNGSVFKLSMLNGAWTYTSLHDFTGGNDGGGPPSNVILDAKGNLYGTAQYGGQGPCEYGCGVVWEITP